MGPIIDVQFKQGDPLGVRRTLIEQYPKLLVPITSFSLRNPLLPLKHISRSAGHVIVHYLHTSTYQTLKWVGPATGNDEAIAKLKTAFEVYVSARKYNMSDLENLAKEQIAHLSKGLDAFLVVDVVNDAYHAAADDESWFAGYMKGVIKKAFDDSTAVVSEVRASLGFEARDNSNVTAKTILRCALDVHRETVEALGVKTAALTLEQLPPATKSPQPESGNKSTPAFAERKVEKESTEVVSGGVDWGFLEKSRALEKLTAAIKTSIEAAGNIPRSSIVTEKDGDKKDKNVILQEGETRPVEGLKVGATPTLGNKFSSLATGGILSGGIGPAKKWPCDISSGGSGITTPGFGNVFGAGSSTKATELVGLVTGGSGSSSRTTGFAGVLNSGSSATGTPPGGSSGRSSDITNTGAFGRADGSGITTTGLAGSSFGVGFNSGTKSGASGAFCGNFSCLGIGSQNIGTARAAFSPVSEKTPHSGTDVYQSNVRMDAYQKWSPDELRLADYDQGRKDVTNVTFGYPVRPSGLY